MIWPAVLTLSLLVLAATLALTALLRVDTLADRLLIMDVLVLLLLSGLAVHAAATGETRFLDVMVVATLLGFGGTTAVALFIQRGERG